MAILAEFCLYRASRTKQRGPKPDPTPPPPPRQAVLTADGPRLMPKGWKFYNGPESSLIARKGPHEVLLKSGSLDDLIKCCDQFDAELRRAIGLPF
jgi:hypothetical protein